MKSHCRGLHIDERAVRAAYAGWVEAPAGRKNEWRVAQEHGSAQALVHEIAREIEARSLTLRPIHRYRSREGPGQKERRIGVESVKQQVCDWLAVQCLEPLLQARVGHWQCGGTVGKGQVFAAKAARKWSQEGGYHVHLDVRKCYPSMKVDMVMGVLERYVASDDVIYLCRTLLGTYDGGLEIGSYLSLRLAQLVLSFGYHHLESLAKVRRGKRKRLITHQLWYADDIWLFGQDKRDLKAAARSLAKCLSACGLAVKPWKIRRVSEEEPVDVAGYTVRPGRTTVRANIYLRARKAFRRYDRAPTIERAYRVCSYWGWIYHSDSDKATHKNDYLRIKRRACKHVSAYNRGLVTAWAPSRQSPPPRSSPSRSARDRAAWSPTFGSARTSKRGPPSRRTRAASP